MALRSTSDRQTCIDYIRWLLIYLGVLLILLTSHASAAASLEHQAWNPTIDEWVLTRLVVASQHYVVVHNVSRDYVWEVRIDGIAQFSLSPGSSELLRTQKLKRDSELEFFYPEAHYTARRAELDARWTLEKAALDRAIEYHHLWQDSTLKSVPEWIVPCAKAVRAYQGRKINSLVINGYKCYDELGTFIVNLKNQADADKEFRRALRELWETEQWITQNESIHQASLTRQGHYSSMLQFKGIGNARNFTGFLSRHYPHLWILAGEWASHDLQWDPGQSNVFPYELGWQIKLSHELATRRSGRFAIAAYGELAYSRLSFGLRDSADLQYAYRSPYVTGVGEMSVLLGYLGDTHLIFRQILTGVGLRARISPHFQSEHLPALSVHVGAGLVPFRHGSVRIYSENQDKDDIIAPESGAELNEDPWVGFGAVGLMSPSEIVSHTYLTVALGFEATHSSVPEYGSSGPGGNRKVIPLSQYGLGPLSTPASFMLRYRGYQLGGLKSNERYQIYSVDESEESKVGLPVGATVHQISIEFWVPL